MNKIFKNLIFSIFIVSIFSCDNSKKITITKILDSPKFENAKLSVSEIKKEEDGYFFSFDINDYEVGKQTPKEFDYELANSSKGQHIHFIVNNDPYSAHYNKNFRKDIKDGDILLAFLSRSYHESVKNSNAYILTEIGEKKQIDLTSEYIFYSRPKGKYIGEETKKILLDFYLVNTQISPNGNKVKVTINDSEFFIYEWTPYYIEGLPKGEITIKLELLDSTGNLLDIPYNPSLRTILLE
jgi:hypothetical protein